jgi:hypothetical protein
VHSGSGKINQENPDHSAEEYPVPPDDLEIFHSLLGT